MTELGGKATSHRRFRHESGVVITVPGHGRQNLREHVGMIVRQLEGAGFDCDTVRRDLNAQSLRATTFVRKAITPPAVIGAIAGSPKES